MRESIIMLPGFKNVFPCVFMYFMLASNSLHQKFLDPHLNTMR